MSTANRSRGPIPLGAKPLAARNRRVTTLRPVPNAFRLPARPGGPIVPRMSSSGRLIRSTGVIAVCTFLSRILGLVREIAFGYFFSTSGLLSAFRIAFMLPNLARRLFGEGALSAAMIPVLTRTLADRGELESRRFIGALLTWLTVVVTLLIAAIEIVLLLGQTLSPDPSWTLAAVILPYMLLICLVAVIGGVLNVRGHFAIPAAAPALLNLSILAAVIIGAVTLRLSEGALMYVVCAGVLVGGLIQLAAVAWALRRVAFIPIFGGALRDPQLRRVINLMGPMALGLSALQINSLMDYLIAYLFIFHDGERIGPAVLGYAQVLYQLPLGVFGIALATAIFPLLSAKAADDDRAGVANVLARGIRLSLFIALPASIGLMFVARPLVATLLQHGRFDAGDTQRVAGALLFYAAGLAAYFTQHLFARTFYALHDSATPARIAGCIVALNFTLNLILVFPLQERGLALATAITATLQVIWLALRLTTRLREIPWPEIARGAFRTAAAAAAMTTVLASLTLTPLAESWQTAPALARLLVLIAAGAGAYTVASLGLNLHELRSALAERGRTDGRAS